MGSDKEIEEKRLWCAKLLVAWNFHKGIKKHDEELIDSLFTAKVLLKKLNAFNIDIFVPDELLLIISVCVNDNPGLSQIILKEILNNIKKRKGYVEAGYCILPEDFTFRYPLSYPIQDIEEEDRKLYNLWEKQKSPQGFNMCDTPQWWQEVMEK